MLATDELIRKATTTTTQFNKLIPQLWAARIEQNLRKRAVFQVSALENTDLLAPGAGDTVYVPMLPDLGAAVALTEGTDMSVTTMSTATSVALTPAEYGTVVEVTRKALDRIKYDGAAEVMDRLSYAMSLAIETAFASLYHTAVPGTSNYFASVYPNAHTSSNIVTTDTLSDTVMLDAIVKLQATNNMPFPDGYYRLYISPSQYESLLLDSNVRNDLRYAAPERLVNGEVGALHGCRIIVTNYIQTATENSITVQKALLMAPRAMTIAWKRRPEAIIDPTLYDMGRRRRFGITADFDIEVLHYERAVCITTY